MLGAAALMYVGLLVLSAPALAATTITVNTTSTSSPSGDGMCSLPEAVDWANGGSDPDCSADAAIGTTTIDLPAGKYVLTQTLKLSATTNIVGGGASTTDIDGGGTVQVVYIWPVGNVALSGVEISGGNSGLSCSGVCVTTANGNDGGGIYNDGALTLSGDDIAGNVTGDGSSGLFLCFFSTTGCAGNAGGDGGKGGGIFNSGTLTIDGSTVAANTTGNGAAGRAGTSGTNSPGQPGGKGGDGGQGGGIYSAGGTLEITNSAISGNSTGAGGNGGGGSPATQINTAGGDAGKGGNAGSGGGVYTVGTTVTITGSTLDGNRTGPGSTPGAPGAGDGSANGSIAAAGHGGIGGGLAYEAGAGNRATLSNATFTGNATGAAADGTDPSNGGYAGAIAFDGTGLLTNVTIADNSSSYGAGAIYLIPGLPLTEQNSIIASNSAGLSGSDNCAGAALTDAGHNIVFGTNSCPGTLADPKLGALAGNGGPTQTMGLGAGSPAIDAVPASACSLTTDQRGVSRPQGAACDAGAYEVAPPNLTALAATASGPGSAAVSGQVTPNLQDTEVTVRYGTSTAYGSTTTPIDMGSGSAATPLAVTLSGLQPSTAYHVQVVATNPDGTSTSGDLTLTTPAVATTPGAPTAGAPAAGVATASVVKAKVTGDVLLVRVACMTAGGGCSGALKLTSHVTTLRGKVVGIKASAPARRKARRRTTVRTVGSGSYTLAAGQTSTVKLTLNTVGRRLLKLRHRLPARLAGSGAASLTKTVTFISKSRRHRK